MAKAIVHLVRSSPSQKNKTQTGCRVAVWPAVFYFSNEPPRRQANKQMSNACFRETLQSLFPELESMPHADTLGRVLETVFY